MGFAFLPVDGLPASRRLGLAGAFVDGGERAGAEPRGQCGSQTTG